MKLKEFIKGVRELGFTFFSENVEIDCKTYMFFHENMEMNCQTYVYLDIFKLCIIGDLFSKNDFKILFYIKNVSIPYEIKPKEIKLSKKAIDIIKNILKVYHE